MQLGLVGVVDIDVLVLGAGVVHGELGDLVDDVWDAIVRGGENMKMFLKMLRTFLLSLLMRKRLGRLIWCLCVIFC